MLDLLRDLFFSHIRIGKQERVGISTLFRLKTELGILKETKSRSFLK